VYAKPGTATLAATAQGVTGTFQVIVSSGVGK
jgi:hypothetical protein